MASRRIGRKGGRRNQNGGSRVNRINFAVTHSSSGWDCSGRGVREKCFEVPPPEPARTPLRVLDYRAKSSARPTDDSSGGREGLLPEKQFSCRVGASEGEREKRSRDSSRQKEGKIKAHLEREGAKKYRVLKRNAARKREGN